MADISIFNPLNEDITGYYDINDDRNAKPFTIKAKTVQKFPDFML